jgi:thiol-disulfide isomerase/thioredoxin
VATNRDERFRNKVVLIDVSGTWCPTCHDAAPALVDLYRRYRQRGLEVVGIAYEMTGDSAIDNRQIRRFRDKFSTPYLLLRGGINVVEETAATLPQLTGFTAYPTTIFLGRDGRVKHVYAGFAGPRRRSSTGSRWRSSIGWWGSSRRNRAPLPCSRHGEPVPPQHRSRFARLRQPVWARARAARLSKERL